MFKITSPVRAEVHTTETINTTVVWDVTPCSLTLTDVSEEYTASIFWVEDIIT
jgi:hypothetical protein